MVQRHAARFVNNDYWQASSVTALLNELNWDTLESTRTLFQLKYVHKMFSSHVAVHPFDYLGRNMYNGLINSYSKQLALKFARVDIVKKACSFSLFYKYGTVSHKIEQTNSDVFFNLCRAHILAN